MKKLFTFMLVLALAGCSYFKSKPPLPCPATGFMEDAATAVFFADAEKNPTDDDVGVRAVLVHLKGECEMSGNAAQIHLTFDVAAERTAAGALIPQQNLSYFIARIAPDETVLKRENFYTSVDFKAGDQTARALTHDLTVPISAHARAEDYKVAIGFTLTPEQLAFNRNENHPAVAQPAPKKHRKKKAVTKRP